MGKFGYKLCQTLKKFLGQISRNIAEMLWANWNTNVRPVWGACVTMHVSEGPQHKVCSQKSVFLFKLLYLTKITSSYATLRRERGNKKEKMSS